MLLRVLVIHFRACSTNAAVIALQARKRLAPEDKIKSGLPIGLPNVAPSGIVLSFKLCVLNCAFARVWPNVFSVPMDRVDIRTR